NKKMNFLQGNKQSLIYFFLILTETKANKNG
ncbi:MAG: hypothetical protein MRECE_34c020, partial [Mycoplasmataceae bacterium CE_OT135]